MPYTQLNITELSKTLTGIEQRVSARFPQSKLLGIASELHQLLRETQQRIAWIQTPNYALRVAVTLFIAAVFCCTLVVFYSLRIESAPMNLSEFVQMLEAGTNDLLLMGGAVFVLVSLERRLKRRRVLQILQKLRALAHVIDLHQLLKDPTRFLPDATTNAASPVLGLSKYELMRYLDYCSELLSLVGKVAAVYAHYFDDALVLSTVEQVESLSSRISQKIWQKIMIVSALRE
jgi:hypothetical protein